MKRRVKAPRHFADVWVFPPLSDLPWFDAERAKWPDNGKYPLKHAFTATFPMLWRRWCETGDGRRIFTVYFGIN